VKNNIVFSKDTNKKISRSSADLRNQLLKSLCKRGGRENYPPKDLNPELLELINLLHMMGNGKRKQRNYEILLFHKYGDEMFLVNTRHAYMSDAAVSSRPFSSIFILQDLVLKKFSAIYPARKAVSDVNTLNFSF
jgi:hypothetical protein